MKLFVAYDDDCLLITPLVSVETVRCENCEEDHGWAITLGWVFFYVHFHFGGHAE